MLGKQLNDDFSGDEISTQLFEPMFIAGIGGAEAKLVGKEL
jgi:hypothetical protein